MILKERDKIYEVADVSESKYLISHFDENCKNDFKYTAHNGDEVVYVDGDSLYRLSDKQLILENVHIVEMNLYRFLFVCS